MFDILYLGDYMYENEKFDNFYEAINNLMNSKLVFASSYISELLHSIADNDEIYNLIARSMINFDFIEQWQISVSSGRLVLPEENLKKIAFIFCMLNNIDDKNLDLNKILEHYYSFAPDIHPFEVFKKHIVETFRDLIFMELNITLKSEDNNFDENQYPENTGYNNFEEAGNNYSESQEENSFEESFVTESNAQQKNIEEIDSAIEEKENLDKMLSFVLEMKTQIRKMKRLKGTRISKIDLIALVSTLEYAIKTNSSEYFYGLVLSIKHLVWPMKKLRVLAEKIEAISNILIRS